MKALKAGAVIAPYASGAFKGLGRLGGSALKGIDKGLTNSSRFGTGWQNFKTGVGNKVTGAQNWFTQQQATWQANKRTRQSNRKANWNNFKSKHKWAQDAETTWENFKTSDFAKDAKTEWGNFKSGIGSFGRTFYEETGMKKEIGEYKDAVTGAGERRAARDKAAADLAKHGKHGVKDAVNTAEPRAKAKVESMSSELIDLLGEKWGEAVA